MASIEKALQIAGRAHEGQKDKDGQPYILHPLRVMNAVEDEPAKIVAEHLQECGYALLCNGRVLMEHGGLLPVPAPRQQVAHARAAPGIFVG